MISKLIIIIGRALLMIIVELQVKIVLKFDFSIGCTSKGMILPFTEGYEVSGTTFANFDESGCAAIGVTSIDGTCKVLCGGWEARFTNTTFENSANKAIFRWGFSHCAIIWLLAVLTVSLPNCIKSETAK